MAIPASVIFIFRISFQLSDFVCLCVVACVCVSYKDENYTFSSYKELHLEKKQPEKKDHQLKIVTVPSDGLLKPIEALLI